MSGQPAWRRWAITAPPGVRLCRSAEHRWGAATGSDLADCLQCAQCGALRSRSPLAPVADAVSEPVDLVPGMVLGVVDALTVRFAAIGGSREQGVRYAGIREVCVVRTSFPGRTPAERSAILRQRFELRSVRCLVYGEDICGRLGGVLLPAPGDS